MAVGDKGYYTADFLEAAAQLLQPVKETSFSRLQLQAGQDLLDAGCGTGIDAVALSQLFDVDVHGIDSDPEMLQIANQRAQAAGASDRIWFHHNDVNKLPYDSYTFDAIYSERLLQHLPNPMASLQELIRTLKPGGRIVITDIDWGTLCVDSRHPDICERILRYKCEEMHHNGRSGRQLYRQLKQCDLQSVSVSVHALALTDFALATELGTIADTATAAVQAGIIDSSDAMRWRDDLQQAAACDQFFANVTMYVASATK